jgi:sulfide:quinone oxidoreductase
VRGAVDLQLYTPEALPMPVAGTTVGQALKGMLEEKRIGFNPSRKLASVGPGERALTFEDGTSASFDLLVHIPPHRSPAPVRESSITGETGWIPVNPGTLETAHERVYAIGDVAAVKLANGMMLPKASVFAHGEAEVVARRIVADIEGTAGRATFDGWGSCFVETGDRNAAYGSGSFYAEPDPSVRLHMPTKSRHVGRVLFEKTWLTAVSGQPAISNAAFGAVNLIGRRLLEQSWLWDRV